MKLLLDTHLLLWMTHSPKRLSRKGASLLSDSENDLFFSDVSLWEVGVKRALDRADFDFDPRLLRSRLLEMGCFEVPVVAEHTLAVGQLPLLHRDPFDRLLLCQAMVEGITLLTDDRTLTRYPVSVLLT